MRVLDLSDIAGIEEYEALRGAYREAVIAHKSVRRIPVGDKVTLIFEDRETLRFQIQEMLRIERTTRPADVQHELDTYNELMPGAGELSATLFIEITESGRIRAELDRLVGLDEHVFLTVGADHRIHASFDRKQMEDDRISAVHYIRFSLTDAQRARFEDATEPAAIEIDHPAYRARQPLTGATRESLIATSRGEAPSLLVRRPESARPGSRTDGERVRVRREADGVVAIEALEPGARLESADANLSAELWGALQETVLACVARGQRCEVRCRAGDEAPGIRFTVHLL